MSRKKLRHMQAADYLPGVIRQPEQLQLSQPWPIILELGCGHAAYTLALARRNPQHYYIGVDQKPDRIWVAAQQTQLSNVRFIISPIELLSKFFQPHQIQTIWLPFPDPQPKPKQAKHRLIALNYLLLYQYLLQPGGTANLKTDQVDLITEAIENVNTLHGKILQLNHQFQDDVMTTYEQKYRAQGKAIHYLKFSL